MPVLAFDRIEQPTTVIANGTDNLGRYYDISLTFTGNNDYITKILVYSTQYCKTYDNTCFYKIVPVNIGDKIVIYHSLPRDNRWDYWRADGTWSTTVGYNAAIHFTVPSNVSGNAKLNIVYSTDEGTIPCVTGFMCHTSTEWARNLTPVLGA